MIYNKIKLGILFGMSKPKKKTITKIIADTIAMKYLLFKSDIYQSPINSITKK